jgi:hypothetical protein
MSIKYEIRNILGPQNNPHGEGLAIISWIDVRVTPRPQSSYCHRGILDNNVNLHIIVQLTHLSWP